MEPPEAGLGVMGGTENGEIDGDERLVVHFNGEPMELAGVWITNLFPAPDGGLSDCDPVGEWGEADIFDTAGDKHHFDFYGESDNGNLLFSFGEELLVTKAVFSIPGNDNNNNENTEYSVGGFSAVPIPPAIVLLGSGLIGLVGLRRKSLRNN